MALTISLRGLFGLCTCISPYSLGRVFVGFNVDLVLLGVFLFSTRILVFCAIVLVGSCQAFCMLCLREGSSLFSYSLMCS